MDCVFFVEISNSVANFVKALEMGCFTIHKAFLSSKNPLSAHQMVDSKFNSADF